VSAQYLSGPSYFRLGCWSGLLTGQQNGACRNPCAIGKFSLVQEANSVDRVYFILCAGGHLVLTKWCGGLRPKSTVPVYLLRCGFHPPRCRCPRPAIGKNYSNGKKLY